MHSQHIVIIGNGIAGLTVARHVRKQSDARITLISGESKYHFSRPALMYVAMGHMHWRDTEPYEPHFWEKNRIQLKQAWVTKVDTQKKVLHFEDQGTLSYDKVVFATGSAPNKFGWPGQDLRGVQGLYSKQDLERFEENTQNINHAVIVGGGLIGIELAEMLQERNIGVTFLVRETNYWDNVLPEAEAKIIGKHIRKHGMDLRLETELEEIIADPKGRVCQIKTKDGQNIDCQFVGLTAGVHPNIDLAKTSNIPCGRGILVNDYLETDIQDVYALGDCAEIVVAGDARNRIEQLWYTGRMQGEALAQTLCGKRAFYERGIWFNSAKFLDIEYQTYGHAPSTLDESLQTLLWHDDERLIRLIFKKNSPQQIVGFNLFGVRYRHAVCETWLREQTPLKEVVRSLGEANCDPEFFKQFEHKILELYNQHFPSAALKTQKRRGLRELFQFRRPTKKSEQRPTS